uniref:Putative multidrug resistance-associated ABC transporter n=1 Tax=Moniliophthora roreri TaxID=221103 RepID=A0A0W0EW54_MONRR
MGLCGHAGAFEFGDACIRESWSAITPAALVLLLSLFSVPITLPLPVKKVVDKVKEPFRTYITLHEAEALGEDHAGGDEDLGDEDTPRVEVVEVVQVWRAVVLVFVGLLEVICWTVSGSYHFISEEVVDIWSGIRPLLVALAWTYTVVRPIARPSATAPFDLLVVYLLQLIAGVLQFGGLLFSHAVWEAPMPTTLQIIAYSFNLAAILLSLFVVLNMPMAIPSTRINKTEIGYSISPEDYTTVWGWVSFNWVYPLVRRGRNTTLNDKDVWSLSPTIQSRPIFIKFSSMYRRTLLRRIWATNSLDLMLDASLTMLSTCFNYLNPFFLNHILTAIDKEGATPADRSKAYVYAVLMFISSLAKAECDLQHLWFGRRAATRVRSELMAAIYDKALKRKDYSGVVDKDKQAEKKDDTASSSPNGPADKGKKKGTGKDKDAEKTDEPKAGADVGKIVNLMAGDANRICQIVTGLYLIYGAPLEIIIGCAYLYQLLGVSAFAGFVVLLAGWPLNTLLAKRSIRIQKGNVAARDKRMGVLNELIGAVKFIKFFAWEERWIDRAMDARGQEMKWMVKARVNSVMFYLLWMSAPILVSIISFWAFVAQGNELTISAAFTAIALFNMIRAPLNVIPTWIVQLLQTKVSLDRIAVYLGEEEVDEQVSSLKKDLSEPTLPGADDDGLGLENATLKWNEVESNDKEKDSEQAKKATPPESSTPTDQNGGGHDPQPSEASDTLTVHSQTPSNGEIGDHRFELKDISVLFPEGELTVVTGPTASGKTALLLAVLGEMTLLSGRIVMSKNPRKVDENGHMHAISYAAQSPWLRHQTIKENILFGYPYDEQRYKAVVEACALKPDLDMLEDGDSTEIGARGVSLSGGQKARVALARAVYARTKYVLLDDPLSAVDSHTSRYLYEHLLCGPLLANRTVVLVTHHVDLVLPGAHYLIRMLDGRIDTQGTIKDLQARGILEDISTEASVDAHREEIAVAEKESKEEDVNEADSPTTEGDQVQKKPRKLVKDEHRETGSVKWSIYRKYLEASSYYIWGILAMFVVMNQLLSVGEKVWIWQWGDAYKESNDSSLYLMSSYHPFRTAGTSEHEFVAESFITTSHHQFAIHSQPVSTTTAKGHFGVNWPNAREHPFFYVGIYAAIGLINMMVNVLSITAQYTGALRASRTLFRQLLVRVVRATFRFHDTTPQGRMLNRFGKDIETIDASLAGSLQAVNSSLASFFASIITIAVVFPLFLLPASVIGFIYRELAISYLNTGRDLRRMESNSRSPIFSDFGELLEGIVTVRAFSAEKRFLDNLHKKIDYTTQMWYGFWMTNRWLLLNFDVLGSLAVFITSLFSISTIRDGAGLAGLCISSALSFTGSVYWACRFWTALELDLNSVERVVEYLDLPQEPPAIIENSRPPAYWPSSTNNNELIRVENLEVKYAPELPAVLQDVSFTLKAGERVGLLGRTGSGKSTLAMSILRFVDPSGGRIMIDGLDISTIGIHDLRSRLTFIPQDATLFSGTLRDNLDPFNEHTDSECLDVLYRVQIMSESRTASRRSSRAPSAIASPETSRPPSIHGALDREETMSSIDSVTDVDAKTTLSLDTQVSAGGTNFSQGQRQLIAMARALLRRSSIIVLDEATSSIDFATDAKIQTTIREEFTNSLLLTVAHRLRTVIDYDRLVVLDKGKLVEFDTPLRLIQKEDGIFRNMCLKSGSYAELEAAAIAKAEKDGQTTSLPTPYQNAETELVNNFKAAALSITTLFRSSRHASKRAYNAGYAAACNDLLMMIQQGVSVGGIDTPGSGASAESDGMTIGKVMDWIEARMEAIKAREEEEDEEEEREKERERGRSTTGSAAPPAPKPDVKVAKAPAAPSASIRTSREQTTSLPASRQQAGTSSQPSSPSPPPAALRQNQRTTKQRATAKADSNQLTPPALEFPSHHHGGSSASSPASGPASAAGFRRRTRSSRSNGNHIQNQNLSLGHQPEAMDVEEDGRERKRVARR